MAELDYKICSHLCGDGHCCHDCHKGGVLGGDQMTFTWEGSPVCCAAWIWLEERRDREKEAKH